MRGNVVRKGAAAACLVLASLVGQVSALRADEKVWVRIYEQGAHTQSGGVPTPLTDARLHVTLPDHRTIEAQRAGALFTFPFVVDGTYKLAAQAPGHQHHELATAGARQSSPKQEGAGQSKKAQGGASGSPATPADRGLSGGGPQGPSQPPGPGPTTSRPQDAGDASRTVAAPAQGPAPAAATTAAPVPASTGGSSRGGSSRNCRHTIAVDPVAADYRIRLARVGLPADRNAQTDCDLVSGTECGARRHPQESRGPHTLGYALPPCKPPGNGPRRCVARSARLQGTRIRSPDSQA